MNLALENVSFSYENYPILKKCSYQFEKDEIYILLGKNGVGKTTLLNLIAGNLQADIGNIEKLDNQDYGFMTDNFFYYESFTLREMSQLIMKLREIEAENFYQDLLDRLQIRSYENTKIEDLSFGTRQRLHLLLTVLHQPKVLLLDEPTNGLDPEQVFHFKELLKDLAKGRITIISTHSLDLARELGDKILLLENKQLQKVENSQNLESEFLQKP